MFSRSTSNFDRLLEKATNPLLLEPDWDSILQVCDCIRSGEVPPKYAASAIKKKLYASNPHVSLFALQVLESCVKNCGTPFHVEITNKSFMEDLRDLAKLTSYEKVRDKILELIQTWAHAFRNDPTARTVQDSLNLMRAEGYKFPVLKESDAMFTADTAPQWADSDTCHRCRGQFSLVQRKHHCRCCGQIFCAKCSAKTSLIPKFGIEKEVRVCDDCFDKLNSKTIPGASSSSKLATDSPAKTGDSKATAPPGKTEQELQEEEELQIALALSQSEAEVKKERKLRTSSLPVATKNISHSNGSSPASGGRKSEPGSPKEGGVDSELSRYLDRNYWEQKPWANEKHRSTSPAPSAPMSQQGTASKVTEQQVTATTVITNNETLVMNGEDSGELDAFLGALRSALEIFVNRMNSNKLRGRPIANDTAVQSLFLNITNMHSQLLQHIQSQDDQRLHLESMQDKLSQIRDARAALDALREEHQDKLRVEAEEAERIRQQQMAKKLEIMRQKKQEYLQYQRQIALQRIQEQEAAMKTHQQNKYWPQNQPLPQQQQPMPNYQAGPGMPSGQYGGGVGGPPPPQQQQYPHGSSPAHGVQYQQQPQQGPPPAQQQQQQHYQPAQANFASYDMRNMAHALPQQHVAVSQSNAVVPTSMPQQQAQQHVPQQHYQPQQQQAVHPQQQQHQAIPQQPQYPNQAMPQHQHPPGHVPQDHSYAQQQQQPPPVHEMKPIVEEAPLISFD